MGLPEKKALKAFQENRYPKLVAEINGIAGYELDFEVKWETLALDDYADLYDEAYTKMYFNPLIAALKDITSDDLGREALKETLKKVLIKNERETFSEQAAYSFENGRLIIDQQPFSNIDEVEDRTNSLTKLLMKYL